MSDTRKISMDDLARLIGYKEIRLWEIEQSLELTVTDLLASKTIITELKQQLEEKK